MSPFDALFLYIIGVWTGYLWADGRWKQRLSDSTDTASSRDNQKEGK